MEKTFYDDLLTLPLVQELETAAAAIRAEYERLDLESLSADWSEKGLYNKGWTVFGFRWRGTDISPAYQYCPVTAAILTRYADLIDTAGFSILQPGTIIYPHEGYVDSVLRMHLGVIVPEGDLRLRVGQDVRSWEEGKCFIFDDTVEHEVWNRTDQKRVALLIDLKKDRLPLGAAVASPIEAAVV